MSWSLENGVRAETVEESRVRVRTAIRFRQSRVSPPTHLPTSLILSGLARFESR